MSYRPKIYLAGKITGSNWRDDIVTLRSESDEAWPILERAVEGFADYVGPFPSMSGSGDRHSEEAIGHASTVIPYKHFTRPDAKALIVENCLSRIVMADYFFAYLHSVEDVGTITEIGFARREKMSRPLEIEVAFSSSELAESAWFVAGYDTAYYGHADRLDAYSAWMQSRTREKIVRLKTDHHFTSQYESPIEAKLGEAIRSKVWGESLVPQYRIGPYRADLAIVDKRIVIECDGHAYHSTKQQRTHDAKRDRYLASDGWCVLRCTGTEIHADVSKVVADIEAVVNSTTSL